MRIGNLPPKLQAAVEERDRRWAEEDAEARKKYYHDRYERLKKQKEGAVAKQEDD